MRSHHDPGRRSTPLRDPYSYAFARASWVLRVVRLLVTTRAVAALSARFLPVMDRMSARLTGGRVVVSALATGLPVVEVTTIGAKSGLERTIRLLAVPDRDALVVIAANFGMRNHPGWYFNVLAHPVVRVTRSGRSREFRVVELSGSARDAAFARAVAMNPGWVRFQQRSGRRIPVLMLVPPDAGSMVDTQS